MATAREVGKQKKKATNTQELKWLKSTLHLSEIQKELLFGTILGDGCLITSRSGKSACLQIRHNIKHKEYVLWKYSFFKEWVLTSPREDHFNDSFYFRTLSHPDLMKVKDIFYKGVNRFIPEDICNSLKTPLSLAVWLMDDGNGFKDKQAFKVSSYGFGLEGNLLLQKCILQNFSLTTNIHEDAKGYRLYFPKRSALTLYSIVKHYIVPCMQYKFATLTP